MWQLPDIPQLSLYKKAIVLIENLLEQGLLVGGQKLPSERELALLLSINRSTVVRALEELHDRGVLIRKRGSGTYVNPDKWGLQSQSIFNWQPPSTIARQRQKNSYLKQAAIIKQQAQKNNEPLLDLSSDTLPKHLLPSISLPDFSKVELAYEEQEPETSLTGYFPFKVTITHLLKNYYQMESVCEQILVTSGTQQALFLATQCLLHPGDAVGIESPSYFYSLPVFQAAGLRLFALPMDDEGITLEGIENLYHVRGIKMIFLNPAFQNPTGSVMSDRRKNKIIQFCSKKHIVIFEDDAYGLLAFRAEKIAKPLKYFDTHNIVIYASSLSSYAGENIRAGWLIAPEQIVRRLANVRLHMGFGISILPQLLAMEYINSIMKKHLIELQNSLSQKAQSFIAFMQKHYSTLLNVSTPEGGLYCYASRKRKLPLTDEEFTTTMFKKNLILAPTFEFGSSQTAFRCNFANFFCGNDPMV